MGDREVPPRIRSQGSRLAIPLVAVLVWCGLIFGTSCTVVTAQGLYAWIAAHVEPETFRRFAVFWGFSWFAVVKGWHAAEYAILFLFLKAALDRIATTDPRRNIILSLGFCLLFALSDEYHQTFVPGRNGTWTDVGIDALGADLAALISNLRRGRRKRVVTVTSEPDDTWTQDALKRNDLDAIKRRVLEDPDYLTDRDFEYQTPLLRAVEFTNIELVEFLLEHVLIPIRLSMTVTPAYSPRSRWTIRTPSRSSAS